VFLANVVHYSSAKNKGVILNNFEFSAAMLAVIVLAYLAAKYKFEIKDLF